MHPKSFLLCVVTIGFVSCPILVNIQSLPPITIVGVFALVFILYLWAKVYNQGLGGTVEHLNQLIKSDFDNNNNIKELSFIEMITSGSTREYILHYQGDIIEKHKVTEVSFYRKLCTAFKQDYQYYVLAGFLFLLVPSILYCLDVKSGSSPYFWIIIATPMLLHTIYSQLHKDAFDDGYYYIPFSARLIKSRKGLHGIINNKVSESKGGGPIIDENQEYNVSRIGSFDYIFLKS